MATATGQRRRVARKGATADPVRALEQFDHVEYMSQHGHEEVATWLDRETGLRAIIAIHDTTLGPGLGGTRLRRYDSSAEALLDVLRLSEGMTYKAAVAGLPLGGAKAVILADGKEESDPALRAARFRAFGRFVESLGGRYITAEDVGTAPQDMTEIRTQTRHVAGIPREAGGSGDPSPSTAYGVVCGMRALVEEGLGRSSLEGVRVAVQGLGHVGMSLAEQLLRDHGATVIAADVRPAIVEEARRAVRGRDALQPRSRRRDSHAGVRRVLALRLRGGHQPRYHSAVALPHRRRGRQQPARRRGPRRGAAARARHPLRGGLRHQRGRADPRHERAGSEGWLVGGGRGAREGAGIAHLRHAQAAADLVARGGYLATRGGATDGRTSGYRRRAQER